MNNIYVWLSLVAVSVIFAIFSSIAVHYAKSKSWWFFEGWRHFVGYFITGIIGYFLVAIRWPNIAKSGNLSVSDFVLCLAFSVGVLGWWPYFFKNITEAIGAIVEGFLKRKSP